MSVFFIKFVHTFIFFFISACVLYVLYSGIANKLTCSTWVALLVVLGEVIVLSITGWKCPLTTLAEKLGASSGSVSDIFLPKWFADRLFGIGGVMFVVACAVVIARWLAQ